MADFDSAMQPPLPQPPKSDEDLARLMQLQKDYEDKKAQMKSLGSGVDMMLSANRWAPMTGTAPTKTNFAGSLEDSVGSSPLDQTSGAVKLQNTTNEYALNKQLQDPTSQKSIDARNSAKKILGGVNPEFADSITDSMSGADVEKFIKEGLAGKAMSGLLGLQGRQLTNDRFNRSLDIKERGLGLQRERFGEQQNEHANKAGLEFENHPIMKAFKNTLNSLDRADSLLQGKEPLTSKSFAIAQNDFVNAVAQGGAATEGKINRELVHTLQDKMNDIALNFGNVQDLRTAQPQVVRNIQNLMNQVRADYEKAADRQAKDLQDSYSSSTNKKLQEVVGKKAERYKSKEKTASKPKTVVQGGHTYTLNDSTGEYE